MSNHQVLPYRRHVSDEAYWLESPWVEYWSFTVSCRVFKTSLPACKANTKVFVLQNLAQCHFSSLAQLRNELRSQLGSTIVSDHHPFDNERCNKGFWRGSHGGLAHVLWCDGVDTAAKTRISKQSLSQAHESDSELEVNNYLNLQGRRKKLLHWKKTCIEKIYSTIKRQTQGQIY